MIDRDCSFQNRSRFEGLLEDARRKTADQLGVSADEIALVRNTSEGNCIVNNGLQLGRGDEVLIWDQNHPTNNVAWDVRAARFGFEVRRVATPAQPSGVDQLVGLFRESFGPRTRVLAVSHISNVSGVCLPIREIAEEARKRDIFFHVDGAQAWGVLNLNLGSLGCDSFAASAHKWFMGPKEAGILFVRKERQEQLWPGVVAPGWGNDADTDLQGARKFESLGQRDDACLAAVGTAADFHSLIGPQRIQQRVAEIIERIKEEALSLGLSLVTPRAAELTAGIVIIGVEGERRRQAFERLYSEFGIAGAASGGLRLSPHVYNTDAHVDRVIAALRAMRAEIS